LELSSAEPDPLAQVFRFETVAEAIAMASDTEFGLASYL
jgi:succinate-semialdehyde dehydrogenase/glutarate-semialdehyde dehydrogenase